LDLTEANNASLDCLSGPASDASPLLTEASNVTLLCHPDDLSIARGGRTSDSFAPAKPVPVLKIAQRTLFDQSF